MATVKEAADQAKSDVERVEAKEDKTFAGSRPRSTRPTKVDRPREASFNQADKAKADVERVEAKEGEALADRQRSARPTKVDRTRGTSFNQRS